MQCFLLTKDLMFSSQASGAVSSAGMESKLVSTPEQISEQEPCVVVLDLTMPGLDVDATVAALQKNPSAKLIAVGPHVHAAKLAAAGQAGCNFVMSKGQASRELVSLLSTLNDG